MREKIDLTSEAGVVEDLEAGVEGLEGITLFQGVVTHTDHEAEEGVTGRNMTDHRTIQVSLEKFFNV